jgi:hypothetical protein
LLRSLEDLGVGVGVTDAGDLGRVMLLLATILAISAVPEEVNAEALENPAAWSWEGGMKWVTRGIRWVAGGLVGLGLAAPGNAEGAGEVGAPVVGLEVPRGAAEAAGFAAAAAVAILAAARRREESVGELEPSSALASASSSSSMASSEAAFSAISWAFDVFPVAVEAGEVGATSGLVGGR